MPLKSKQSKIQSKALRLYHNSVSGTGEKRLPGRLYCTCRMFQSCSELQSYIYFYREIQLPIFQ